MMLCFCKTEKLPFR